MFKNAIAAVALGALIAAALGFAYSLEAGAKPLVLKYFTRDASIVNESSIVKLGSLSIVEVYPYDNGTVKVVVRPPSFKEFLVIYNNYWSFNVFENGRPLPPEETYRRYVLEFTINETVIYVLDENNYVTNIRGMGFFPLYSRIPLTPEVVERLRPSYMGKELGCYEGTCIYYYALRLPNGSAYTINVLHLADKNMALGFDYRWNYLVQAYSVELPLNDTHRIVLDGLEPCPPTIELLVRLPDYDEGVDEGVYLVLAVAVAAVVAVAVVLKRRG